MAVRDQKRAAFEEPDHRIRRFRVDTPDLVGLARRKIRACLRRSRRQVTKRHGDAVVGIRADDEDRRELRFAGAHDREPIGPRAFHRSLVRQHDAPVERFQPHEAPEAQTRVGGASDREAMPVRE